MEAKVSDFIDKHSVTNSEGKKQINAVAAIIELWARIQNQQEAIKELQEAMSFIVTSWDENNPSKKQNKIEIVQSLPK